MITRTRLTVLATPITLLAMMLLLLASAWAAPAGAGGSWFNPVLDRYEPGDTATLVGYTGGGSLGWVDDGPFFGFLAGRVDEDYLPISSEFERIAVGRVDITRTAHGGYLSYRAAISFELPAELEVGRYRFDYCNETCDKQFGDLIGGFFWVGVDPDYEITRYWAPDEPEIANLEPGRMIAGPGLGVAETPRITPDLTPPPTPAQSGETTAPVRDGPELDAVSLSSGSETAQSLSRAMPNDRSTNSGWFAAAGVLGLVVATALWRRRSRAVAD